MCIYRQILFFFLKFFGVWWCGLNCVLHAGRARCQVVAVMYRVHLHFWLLAALSTAPSDVAQEPGQSIKPHGTALRFFLQKDFGLKAFFFFFPQLSLVICTWVNKQEPKSNRERDPRPPAVCLLSLRAAGDSLDLHTLSCPWQGSWAEQGRHWAGYGPHRAERSPWMDNHTGKIPHPCSGIMSVKGLEYTSPLPLTHKILISNRHCVDRKESRTVPWEVIPPSCYVFQGVSESELCHLWSVWDKHPSECRSGSLA